MKVSEILNRAADLIEPEGAWTKDFTQVAVSGPHCLLSAIGDAAPDSMIDVWPIIEIVASVVDVPRETLHRWNDAPERTQAEVVSALREAASLAKEQEASNEGE